MLTDGSVGRADTLRAQREGIRMLSLRPRDVSRCCVQLVAVCDWGCASCARFFYPSPRAVAAPQAGYADTVRTEIYTGRPCRVLKTPFVKEWLTTRADEARAGGAQRPAGRVAGRHALLMWCAKE